MSIVLCCLSFELLQWIMYHKHSDTIDVCILQLADVAVVFHLLIWIVDVVNNMCHEYCLTAQRIVLKFSIFSVMCWDNIF